MWRTDLKLILVCPGSENVISGLGTAIGKSVFDGNALQTCVEFIQGTDLDIAIVCSFYTEECPKAHFNVQRASVG